MGVKAVRQPNLRFFLWQAKFVYSISMSLFYSIQFCFVVCLKKLGCWFCDICLLTSKFWAPADSIMLVRYIKLGALFSSVWTHFPEISMLLEVLGSYGGYVFVVDAINLAILQPESENFQYYLSGLWFPSTQQKFADENIVRNIYFLLSIFWPTRFVFL